MDVSIESIKKLRAMTGAGLTDETTQCIKRSITQLALLQGVV